MTYEDKKLLDEKIQIAVGAMFPNAHFAEKQAKFYREIIQLFEDARHRLWSAKEEDFSWHDPF